MEGDHEADPAGGWFTEFYMPAGRVFLSCLYRLMRSDTGCKVKTGHHHRLNTETAVDLKMFQQFLNECAETFEKSVSYLHRLDLDSSDIQLFADSTGTSHLGMGCTFQNEWQ